MGNKKQKRRRSYGIGRKYMRGSIWWVAIYDGLGNQIRESTNSTKESDADDLLGQKLRERSRGELVPIDASDGFTTADLLDEFLRRRKHLASGTVRTYRYQAETLLKPYFGAMAPSKITTDILSDYRDWRSLQKVSHHNSGLDGTPAKLRRTVTETSINRELGLLRSALRDVAKRRPKMLSSVPYFPMEEEHNARQGFVSERDFAENLYPQLPRHLRALAACAFYVGGRKSEWLRVDWEDVDFDALVIRFVTSKNRHPREVPIVPGLMLESLREALNVHNAAWPDEPAVFAYDGHRMSTVGAAWKKACERAGHSGLMFHDLRRSANKNMRDRGISQGVRMQIMGHRTASMDLRYGIVDREDITAAREKLATAAPKLRRVK